MAARVLGGGDPNPISMNPFLAQFDVFWCTPATTHEPRETDA